MNKDKTPNDSFNAVIEAAKRRNNILLELKSYQNEIDEAQNDCDEMVNFYTDNQENFPHDTFRQNSEIIADRIGKIAEILRKYGE